MITMDEIVIKKRAAGRPVIDMTGQKYGRLTVVGASGIHGGRAYWLCQCACGERKILSGRNLRTGRVLSCGCLREESGRHNIAANARWAKVRAAKSHEEFLERQMIRNQEAGLRFDDFWMFGPGGQEWFERMVI